MSELPLVLLPGMNCSKDLWAEVSFGETIDAKLDQPSVEQQVLVLLQELPHQFVLGGLSLGGIVAMALAAQAPERVLGLVLAATNAKAPTAQQRAAWQQWQDQLNAGVPPRELQQSILKALISPERARTRPELTERALALSVSTDILNAQLKMQSTREDLSHQIRKLQIPTLVIAGSKDVICPPTFHEEIAAQIPNASYVSLDAGHLVPIERPGEFAHTVLQWRSKHRI